MGPDAVAEDAAERAGLSEGALAPWLPAPAGESRAVAAATHPELVLNVLIVDQEPGFLGLAGLLARAPDTRFAVERASGVEAGLRRLAAGGLDACLVASRLPGRDGLEFARLAQARGFEVPMILIGEATGAGEVAGATPVRRRMDLDSLEVGAADYLERAELAPDEPGAARLERALRFAVARRRQLARLDRLAQFDPLTGLANRALFQDRLERALATARRQGSRIAVMVLDLNGFKPVNDRLGHGAGDELLQVVADRLAGRLRQTDTAARLGGDEFAVCAEHLAKPEDAPLVAQKLLDALGPPITLAGGQALVTGSLGVALFPGDAEDAATLLRHADAAMYRAKSEGGNRCRFHDPRLDGRMRQGALVEAGLRQALESDALALHFEPQVTLGRGALGLAASVHWRHPELGLADAVRLRAMAEDTGLAEALTDWLIRAACGHAREWQEAGFERVHVAVPILSRRQLAWSGLESRVQVLLRASGLAPGRLELELGERLLAQELQAGSGVLPALKRQGLRLALHDFGSGEISLAVLRDAPLDTVKLSPALLRGTPDDARQTATATSVVRLARRLGLRVVAAGVENPAQLHMLRREGCTAVQGPMSCPPLPASACLDWLREADLRG
ncbi:MAG TPA: EAL domain-containing protein [Geminicoccaceae bacterium]|nr:EAL domain-containing protein [Geminicoccaceae bacterium]